MIFIVFLRNSDRYPVVPALEQVAGQLASRPGNAPEVRAERSAFGDR